VTRHEELQQKVREYHKKHPEVWDLFVRFSFELLEKGYRHYSVSGVFDRIRWEQGVGEDGVSDFKIGNNFKPFYARAFMKKHPEAEGFYRLRYQNTKDKPARESEVSPCQLSYEAE
jgi:hypothetical protein